MIVLAIDTASRSCSVAVLDGNAVMAEINDVSGQTHSRHLMGMVDQAISMSVGQMAQIDGYAVTQGPGSFTGLRIGISTAKGLAEATGKPLVGVSSLQALAWQVFPSDAMVIPMLDARRKEVYSARYIREGEIFQMVGAEQALSPEAAVEGVDTPCVLIGDGAVAYSNRLATILGNRMRLALPFQHIIRASTVAFLACERLIKATDERMTLVPRYIRENVMPQDMRENVMPQDMGILR
jgi:tRNA threonylcarbamoyladenosine biosynthesis protein TsaB